MDVKEFNLRAIERFRADRDVEGFEHLDLLLLTTTGAKSGRPHTTPLARRRDGDRLLVVAANTGGRKDPDWYVNILANSKVTVELGDQTYEAVGIPLDGPEYDETWRRLKDDHPYLGEYELSAGRTIPVIVLVPSVTAVQAGR